MQPTCLCKISYVATVDIISLPRIIFACGELQQEIGKGPQSALRHEKLYLMELHRGKLRINPLGTNAS